MPLSRINFFLTTISGSLGVATLWAPGTVAEVGAVVSLITMQLALLASNLTIECCGDGFTTMRKVLELWKAGFIRPRTRKSYVADGDHSSSDSDDDLVDPVTHLAKVRAAFLVPATVSQTPSKALMRRASSASLLRRTGSLADMGEQSLSGEGSIASPYTPSNNKGRTTAATVVMKGLPKTLEAAGVVHFFLGRLGLLFFLACQFFYKFVSLFTKIATVVVMSYAISLRLPSIATRGAFDGNAGGGDTDEGGDFLIIEAPIEVQIYLMVAVLGVLYALMWIPDRTFQRIKLFCSYAQLVCHGALIGLFVCLVIWGPPNPDYRGPRLHAGESASIAQQVASAMAAFSTTHFPHDGTPAGYSVFDVPSGSLAHRRIEMGVSVYMMLLGAAQVYVMPAGLHTIDRIFPFLLVQYSPNAWIPRGLIPSVCAAAVILLPYVHFIGVTRGLVLTMADILSRIEALVTGNMTHRATRRSRRHSNPWMARIKKPSMRLAMVIALVVAQMTCNTSLRFLWLSTIAACGLHFCYILVSIQVHSVPIQALLNAADPVTSNKGSAGGAGSANASSNTRQLMLRALLVVWLGVGCYYLA